MRQKHFEDITEAFEYFYPELQEIGGVNYKHIYGGVYQPENPVELMWEEFRKLAGIYCDLVFHVKKPEEYFDDELREWVAVNPEETYVVYFVNSRYMAQYDYCFENYIRGRQEFAAVRDILEVENLDDICWSDRYQEEEMKGCITGLCQFQKVDLNDRYQGYSKHIQIGNKVGYLIEPGIYYFENPEGEERLWKECPTINLNRTFEKEVAVIGYATDFHPSFNIAVTYLAIGKKNFARLKEIQSTLEYSFFHEFEVAKEQKKTEVVDLDDLLMKKKDAEEETDELELPKVEPEAKELLEGIGFQNIRLGYHMAFSERVSVREYEMAYILNDKLVLIWAEHGNGLKRSEYDLRLFGELTVRVDVQLNCGLKMERDIKVIDCKEKKMQEMLEIPG